MEGQAGKIFHGDMTETSLTYHIASFVLYMIFADFWFYLTHRLWHEVEFFYNHSHFWHHASRPVSSFAGNAADALELIVSGESQVFFPALLVPMHARTYLIAGIVNQVW